MFETGGVVFAAGWLEFATTAVFDLLVVIVVEVFVVELFAVVLLALLQAEKSNADDTRLNIEIVVILKIFIFSLSEAAVFSTIGPTGFCERRSIHHSGLRALDKPAFVLRLPGGGDASALKML